MTEDKKKRSISKSLLYKRFYKNISESIIPNISIEQIGQILSEAQRLPPSASYELKEFPVNFKSVLEGTRKDIIFHYKHLIPEIKTSNDGNKIIDGWKLTGIRGDPYPMSKSNYRYRELVDDIVAVASLIPA